MGLSASAPRMPKPTVAQPTASRGKMTLAPRITQPTHDTRYTTTITYTLDPSCIPATDWYDLSGRVPFDESCAIMHALANGTLTQH